MKTPRRMNALAGGLAALLAVGLTLGGCAGRAGSPTPGTGGTTGTGNSGNGGTGNGGGGSGGTPMLTLECPSPKTGSPSLRLLTRNELLSSLNDVFPEVRSQWTADLPASTISGHGFDNANSAEIGQQLAGKLLETAESLGAAVTGSAFATILPCATGAGDRACAETFLNKYGKRLFRRPLTADEKSTYLGFFDASRAKSDFKMAMKWLTVALVTSPSTLYRSEIGTDSGGMRQLTPHEIVTELAYTYTGSTPSDALLSMADSGNLGDIGALARSLLDSDAGKRMLQKFFEQYLGYSSVSSLTKPDISSYSQVSADMVRETSAFIDQVVIQNRGGMKELLTAPFTTPSRALASYYAGGEGYSGGFPMPASDYAMVSRPAGLGVGVLAQGSFLATHASSDTSSPTKRGLFVYYKLFCRPHLQVPDNVPQLDTTTPMPNINTTRDRYEKLHTVMPGGCSSCHTLFDPLGFGFEHFDEGGRYRAKEGNYDVNSAATAPSPGGTLTFTSQEDMMNQISQQPIVHQCLSAYLSTFAFGSAEACIGSSQVSALQSGSIGIAEAFARLASEPHFTKRNAQ